MEEEKKGFVIKDKRLFDESGAARTERTNEQEPATIDKKVPARPEEARTSEEPAATELSDEDYIPEVNFANFIISLSTTVLFHLGDFNDEANNAEKNLPAAKQIIDTISMLKEKTEGNLDLQEKDLIEGVLYELKMRYVKETS